MALDPYTTKKCKTCNLGYIIVSMLYTDKRTKELHQFQNQLSYDADLSPCQV